LDVFLAEIVQDPEAHLPGRCHWEFGDGHRVKGWTKPLFRFQTQSRRRVLPVNGSLQHQITPASVCVEVRQFMREFARFAKRNALEVFFQGADIFLID
jgi:hypothetical protein